MIYSIYYLANVAKQALVITRPDKDGDLGLGEVLLDKVKRLVFN